MGPHLLEQSALRDDFSSACCTHTHTHTNTNTGAIRSPRCATSSAARAATAERAAALSVPAHAHVRYMLFERQYLPAATRYASLLSLYAAAAAHSIGTSPGAP